jgi:hypothetical protein
MRKQLAIRYAACEPIGVFLGWGKPFLDVVDGG